MPASAIAAINQGAQTAESNLQETVDTELLNAVVGAESAEENKPMSDAEMLASYMESSTGLPDEEDLPKATLQESAEDTPGEVDFFTVKINGAESRVSKDDLIANYQKNEASATKFEQAQVAKSEWQAKNAALTSQHAQLQAAIDNFRAVAVEWKQSNEPDWDELAAHNPHEYLLQQRAHAAKAQEWEQANVAQSALNQRIQEQHDANLQASLAEEAQKMTELFPEWADEKVKDRDATNLLSFLQNMNYTTVEIENLNNSKASNIRLVVDAMHYRALLKTAKANTKQVKSLPPRMERSNTNPQSTSATKTARERLSKSGSIADAAAALLDFV
jgi:hypothetical protein